MLKGLSRRQLRYPWMVLKMGDKVHLASIFEVETGVAVIAGIKPQAIAGHVFNPGDFVWLKPDPNFPEGLRMVEATAEDPTAGENFAEMRRRYKGWPSERG